ncbi:MAG: hypothetical protein ACWA6U_07895 [Breznakibacter sp.]
MLKIPIRKTIPDAVNHLVVTLARTKRVRPQDVTLEMLPKGSTMFNVSIMNQQVGTIAKAFETMMFIPN